MEKQILDSQEEENKGKKLVGFSAARDFYQDLSLGSRRDLDLGKSKSEIFSQFVSKYGTRYQKKISKIVGFSISAKEESDNKAMIQVLIGLQMVAFIGQLLIGYTFYTAGGSTTALFFSVAIFLWLDISIIRKLLKGRFDILPTIILFSAYRLFGIYTDLNTFQYGEWIYVYGLAVFGSLVLAFWLKRKLFPNFGFFGPKKGEFETYKF